MSILRKYALPAICLLGWWPALGAAQTVCPGSDEIVIDCNGNGTDDYCDITAFATSADVNTNAIPDECDVTDCREPWSGFEPVPPFTPSTPIDGLDIDGDGSAWVNPSGNWTLINQGCPLNQGKALKGVANNPPTVDTLVSEHFVTLQNGRPECGAHVYTFTADFRYEASPNPRADWQLSLRDGFTGTNVALIHWASTQSNFPGVAEAQGGHGRGRILVRNPAGSPAFINTGFVNGLNTCHRIEVALDNNAPSGSAVRISINGALRVSTARLEPTARRMHYFVIQRLPNGQGAGGLNRLALDNATLCRSGPSLTWPDCNANCVDDAVELAQGSSQDCPASIPNVPDECEPDCNSNGTPDACDFASGTSQDCNTNGQPDECDIAAGTSMDCNSNGVPEECDLSSGASADCNGNGEPDSCDIALGTGSDCNGNLTPDDCDLLTGAAPDCNGNQVPDECDVDPASVNWRIRPTLSPRPAHAMAYDSARGVSVLFGGRGINTLIKSYLHDTWAWDGIKWTLRSTAGPSARGDHAMAYDSGRSVVVLFGGRDDYRSLYRDTWEWDGVAWQRRSTTGPAAQSGHAMAYDSTRAVTVLLGRGTSTSHPPETWEWDGATWALRSIEGPTVRINHTMAFDTARGVTVLFGGKTDDSSAYLGETWEWDGVTWVLRSITGPTPGAYEMAYDDARGVCVLLGGGTGPGQSMETWEWDGDAWTQRSDSGPSYRGGHALVYDRGRGVTMVFGGTDEHYYYGGAFGDTWEWDGTMWTLSAAGGPSIDAEAPSALAFDSARGITTLFVGWDPHSAFGQTVEWDGESWTRHAPTGPSARSGLALANDSARNVTVLFGGYDDNFDGETWEWDGNSWTLRTVAGPSPRNSPAMAYDSVRAEMILFGGYEAAGRSGETWGWDGSIWTLRSTLGPTPRAGAAMAFDSARGVIVLFGGWDADGPDGETWEWDGQSWTLRATAGAPAIYPPKMAYDSARGVTVLVGSEGNWEWDGIEWSLRPFSVSPASAPVAYDSARRVMMAYTTYFGTMWELSSHSFDCNANGVPDSCESISPCAYITSAASWRTHGGGVGRGEIAINPAGRVGTGGVTSEPRIGGIDELRIAFNSPPGSPASQPVSIEQRTCGDSGAYVPYTGLAQPITAIDGHELVLHFTPALENAATYRIHLGSEISAVPGQSIEVRGLVGDANSDGRVNGADRSTIVAAWTGPAFSPQTDLTLDGRTNAADRAVAVSIWTGTENCAP